MVIHLPYGIPSIEKMTPNIPVTVNNRDNNDASDNPVRLVGSTKGAADAPAMPPPEVIEDLAESLPEKLAPAIEEIKLRSASSDSFFASAIARPIIAAYVYSDKPFRWGEGYLTPSVFYIPSNQTDPPLGLDSFEAALPEAPNPTETATELTYAPKVALSVHLHPIDSISYKLPDPPNGYVAPDFLPVVDKDDAEGQKKVIVNVNQSIYREKVFMKFPDSTQKWLGDSLTQFGLSIDILHLNPKVIQLMTPFARDRLLDALEDHGSREKTKVKIPLSGSSDPREFSGYLGPAATLAILMKVRDDEQAFATIIGTRPIPVISELHRMGLSATFRPGNVPWIIYYSLPRLHQLVGFEQGLTAVAVSTVVTSIFEGHYIKSGEPNSQLLYTDFKRAREWLAILPKLNEAHPQTREFHFGTMHGILLAGAMLFAFKVADKDEKRRKWIKWAITSAVAIGLGAASGPGAPIVVGAVEALTSKTAGALAGMIIQKKDWVESLNVLKIELERSIYVSGSENLAGLDATFFAKGFKSVIELIEAAREIYEKKFASSPTIRDRIAQNNVLDYLVTYAFGPPA